MDLFIWETFELESSHWLNIPDINAKGWKMIESHEIHALQLRVIPKIDIEMLHTRNHWIMTKINQCRLDPDSGYSQENKNIIILFSESNFKKAYHSFRPFPMVFHNTEEDHGKWSKALVSFLKVRLWEKYDHICFLHYLVYLDYFFTSHGLSFIKKLCYKCIQRKRNLCFL